MNPKDQRCIKYEVLVSGTTCIADQHDAHQGPGLALATCTQCAAIFAQQPEYIDSDVIDNIVRLGSLTYDSLQNPHANAITSLRPILEEHEHLRMDLNLLYEDKQLCPRLTKEGENSNSSSTTSTDGTEDTKTEGKTQAIYEEVLDEETKRLVEGHVIHASTVSEYLTRLSTYAHTSASNSKNKAGRRDSSIRFGSTLTAASGEEKSRGGSGFGESGNRSTRASALNSGLGRPTRTTVYIGIICTEQLSLAVIIVKGKTGNDDGFLVFDPMRRDGKFFVLLERCYLLR